jgi:hypothetical protein
LVVAVASALLVTGACGSGDGGAAGPKASQKTPLEAVLASSSRTAEAKSSKMAFSLTTKDVQGAPHGNVTVGGEGAFDYAARQGAFIMNFPAIDGHQEGSVEAVTKDSTIYQKLPPELGSLLGASPGSRST